MEREAAGGGGFLIAVVLLILWWNGFFDHFLVKNGLGDFAKGPCIENLIGQVFCGDDEIRYWCLNFALNTPENRSICLGL